MLNRRKSMNNHILTRMGDGAQVSIPVDEVKEDILSGTRDSAERGKIPDGLIQ